VLTVGGFEGDVYEAFFLHVNVVLQGAEGSYIPAH